jgi:alkanesulfonate monooxygenase SsuD/methylene tetrahydromethanopterin reductase-like flavin-dependent oxidoreductase (luciferase family)
MSQVGLVFAPRSPEQIAQTIRVMEERGFALAGLLDTHSRAMDVYVALAIAAANSSKIRIGPCVTNPNTRDISVTAAAISSIDRIAPGRTYLGISKGFAATAAVGIATSKTSSLNEIIPQIRTLIAGDSVQADGRSMQVHWSRARIPIYIAASGPMALRIAGRVADGAIMHMGHSPEVVADVFRHVKDGALEAGRDAGDLDLWLYGASNCSSDGDAARESVKGAIAGMGASVFRPNTNGKHVPPAFAGPVAELVASYAIDRHMQPGIPTNEQLIDRLGLSNFLLDRFAIAGTPSQVRDKKRALEGLGVRNFLLNITMSQDLPETVRALADALEIQPER